MNYNKMRVKRTEIRKQTNVDYDKVILKIEAPFEDFLEHIDIAQYQEWTDKDLHKKYMVKPIQKNVVQFDYQYLLIETDHQDLLEVISHILQEFTAYSIQCLTKYAELINAFAGQIEKFDGCFLASLLSGTLYTTFTLYYHQDSHQRQEIEYRINKLSEFKEETLIYVLSEASIKSKLSLRSLNLEDIRIYLSELVKNYEQSISKYIGDNMVKTGLRGSIIIGKIDFFADLNKLNNLNIEMRGISGENQGLIFSTFGVQQAYSKLHTFIERWFEKLSTVVVEVDGLECCKKSELPYYFKTKFNGSQAIALSSFKDEPQRILIFDPPKGTHSTHDLHHFFKTTNRIITGLQFPDLNFKLLHDHWNQFINATSLNLRVAIYEHYLLVSCTRGQEIKLREKIKEFLEGRIIENIKISQFKTSFEIALFQAIYLTRIAIKNADFYVQVGSLYRSNFVKDGEELDKRVREIYRQMKKQLIFVPISKPLRFRRDYFCQTRAKEWEDMECLSNQQFKLEKKITVNVRSYTSISSNEQDCIFIVQDVKKCAELLSIFEEEETLNIEKKLAADPILGFSLRYCKYFNNITVCSVVIRNDRSTRWVARLGESIEKLISSHETSRHIKFMFHQHSHQAIKIIVPIVIDSVRSNCSLRAEFKIKEVTFFASASGGKELRNEIVTKLKESREKNIPITKVCELNLKTSELEKIITYGYFTLKYFQDEETREASSLSSFIFHTELRKNKKTPIFLPDVTEKKNKKAEYLVSCFNETVFKITGRKIEKINLKHQKLNTLKAIMIAYFPTIEYFATFGNEEGTSYCLRLFYTSTSERHYKSLERAGVDMEGQKIFIQKELIKYELISNEFLELRKVETHPSKKTELLDSIN